jgi:hypothetical protein
MQFYKLSNFNMADVPEQAPPRSSSQVQAQSNADFGAESSQDVRDATRVEQERIENEKIDFIRSKTKEIESSSTPPTYKEVADLFKQFQPTNYAWQSTFTRDHKNMAPAYYELANTIIEKWKAKESMSDEEALWITRHLNLILIDKGSIKGHKLFEDAKFRKQIMDTIRERQKSDRGAFQSLLRNIELLTAAAAAAAPAAVAPAAAAAAAPAVDPDLGRLMGIFEAQIAAGNMTENVYMLSMNALRDLHRKLQNKGGYRRRTKHSKKHSKKSRKCRKSRRH